MNKIHLDTGVVKCADYKKINDVVSRLEYDFCFLGMLCRWVNFKTNNMKNISECNIDNQTIRKVGLRISTKPINAQIALNSRIFEYPHLDDVFIMESDLYGNVMPKNSCFLAFTGKHGLIGKKLNVETLKRLTVTEMEKIVHDNKEG